MPWLEMDLQLVVQLAVPWLEADLRLVVQWAVPWLEADLQTGTWSAVPWLQMDLQLVVPWAVPWLQADLQIVVRWAAHCLEDQQLVVEWAVPWQKELQPDCFWQTSCGGSDQKSETQHNKAATRKYHCWAASCPRQVSMPRSWLVGRIALIPTRSG